MKTCWISGVLFGCLATGCGSVQDVQDQSTKTGEPHAAHAAMAEDEGDENVALAQVPDSIKQAAQAAVSGFVLTSAETETEDGTMIYSLEGTADGEAVEVEVRVSDGKVLEIERGDDEEDGDDDDDDDDDEDEGDDD